MVGLLQIGTVENGIVLKKRGNCGEKFTVLAEEMKLVKLLVFTKKIRGADQGVAKPFLTA